MGAKIVAKVPSTTKKRLRVGCAECSRKFATVASLTDHKLKVHGKPTRRNVAMNRAIAGPSAATKTAEKCHKCQLCRSVFVSRVMMLKHLKDKHAGAGSDTESKPSLQNDLKCATCTKKFLTRKAMLLHICKTEVETNEPSYRCSGCKAKISSLVEMDTHVISVHHASVDIVFFNNERDFQEWKKSEENLTKMRYTVQSNIKHPNKVIYRCSSRIKVAKENVKDLCPAAIVVSSESNKIKLSYHKKHYGHPHIELVSEHNSEQDDGIGDNDDDGTTEIKIENLFQDTEMDTTEPSKVDKGIRVKKFSRESVSEKSVSEGKGKVPEGKWMCLGCKQFFYAIRSLHLHMSSVHSEELFSILFPGENEFNKWKAEMESETKTKYNAPVKHDLGAKQFNKTYYTCATHMEKAPAKEGYLAVCPSTIVTQKYDTGIQIHFYQKHYNHKYNNYNPSEDVKKYQIKNIFEGMVGSSKTPQRMDYGRQLYYKFKHLTNNMISVSEQLSADDLKILIEKITPIGLLVDDMVRVKNELNILAAKRKIEEDQKAATNAAESKAEEARTGKKREVKADETRAVKKLRETKPEEAETPKQLKESKPEEVRTSIRIKNRLVSGITKLNDSANKSTKPGPKRFKKYLHKYLHKTRSDDSDSDPHTFEKYLDYVHDLKYGNPDDSDDSDPHSKEKYLDYIHELKYGKSEEPDSDSQTTEQDDNTHDSETGIFDSNDDVPSANDTCDTERTDDTAKKAEELPKPAKDSPKVSIENSPASSTFNDTYKSFIQTNNWVPKTKTETEGNIKTKPEPVPRARRGEKVKTKLGQFSPKKGNQDSPKNRNQDSPKYKNQASPKHTKKDDVVPVQKSTEKPIYNKVVVERYEVKEQDDDCNILILKM